MERGTIFANKHENENGTWVSYNFSKAGKDRDGNTIYASIPIRFRKGVDVANKTYIEIKDSFLTPFPYGKDANGKQKTVMGIMCLDYAEVVTREEAMGDVPGFSAVSEFDVPF